MPEYEFTLVLHGDLDEATADALFKVGCDDATVGVIDGVGYADFVRVAPTLGDALLSAIEQVESIPGLTIVTAARPP